MMDGTGLSNMIPSLEDQLKKTSIKHQVCIIRNGFKADSLGKAMNVMPAHAHLQDVELTNLINYINHRWNNNFNETSILEIIDAQKNCD